MRQEGVSTSLSLLETPYAVQQPWFSHSVLLMTQGNRNTELPTNPLPSSEE